MNWTNALVGALAGALGALLVVFLLPGRAPDLTSAVIAFDAAGQCPDGWSEFAPAAGRTILGAGRGAQLSARSVGETGGQEGVMLKPGNVPTREVTQLIEPPMPETPEIISPDPAAPIALIRKEVGGSSAEPHDNMPPFVVLRYCVR